MIELRTRPHLGKQGSAVYSPGGGVIQVNVGGTLTVNGIVSANGSPAFRNDQGGAAGGSIWLNVGQLTGDGVITADGGRGEQLDAGGGAGGRIAIYHQGFSIDPIHIAAIGAIGRQRGGDGTIYFGNDITNLPPVVLAQSPGGAASGWIDHVDVTFSTAIDAATFTPADAVLTAPDGALPGGQLVVTNLTPQTWRIAFPTQTADGDYTVQVGPNIANPPGQAMPATYTGSFSINVPRTLTLTQSGGNLQLTWPTTAGLFYQLQSTEDLVTWTDVGSPMAGSGALVLTTIPIGTDGMKFFRLALLENETD